MTVWCRALCSGVALAVAWRYVVYVTVWRRVMCCGVGLCCVRDGVVSCR